MPRDLRHFKDFFRRIGGQLTHVDGTGEDRFRHPLMDRPVTVHAQRKDVPRALTTFAKRVLDVLMLNRLRCQPALRVPPQRDLF